MKRLIVAIALLLASVHLIAAQTSNSETSPTIEAPQVLTQAQIQAKNELNDAARAYRNGNFAEAQRHSEMALLFDPSNKVAPSFTARTIHAQYKPGIKTPENIAKGREAIEAYKRLLAQDKTNDEAYKAVAALYEAIGENDLQREWITQRALDDSAKPESRAEAYVVLASRDWDCSYRITELPENKIVVKSKRSGKFVIHYLKPKDLSEYDKAQACVSRGLEEAEKAINLDSTSESAWSYKTNLLLEAAKLAEMDDNRAQQDDYKRQADEVQKRLMDLVKENSGEKPAPLKP